MSNTMNWIALIICLIGIILITIKFFIILHGYSTGKIK